MLVDLVCFFIATNLTSHPLLMNICKVFAFESRKGVVLGELSPDHYYLQSKVQLVHMQVLFGIFSESTFANQVYKFVKK